MPHHHPTQLNFLEDLGRSFTLATNPAVSWAKHAAADVSRVTTSVTTSVVDTTVKVGKGLAQDVPHIGVVPLSAACGVGIGGSQVISKIPGIKEIPGLHVPGASSTSYCGCILKSEGVVQHLAGSREKVEATVKSQLASTCSRKIDGVPLLQFLKTNYEPMNLDEAMFNTTAPVRKERFGRLFPEVDEAQRTIKAGIHQASIGLGHCDHVVEHGTLNENCKTLQSFFPKKAQMCSSSSKCCLDLLDSMC